MTDEITNVQSGYFTQERIQGDLDYRRAQTIAKKMLDDGLISVAEFNKLTAINRETFSLQTAGFPGRQGRISRPCRAELYGQCSISVRSFDYDGIAGR